MKTKLHSLLIGLTLAVSVTGLSAQNSVVTYQGRVQSDSSDFTGTGQFKFALVTVTNTSTPAAATAILTGQFVTSYPMVAYGSGYLTPPAVTVSGGGGSGATAVAVIAGGMVTEVNAVATGSGYTSTPTVTIAPPPEALAYTTYWSNDGTSVAGGEPAAAVSLPVNAGLVTARLGDASVANMMALPGGLFSQPDLHLRLWFDDGVNGFAVLHPTQPLSAAPYAFTAGGASNLLGTMPATQLSGPLPSANLSGTYSGAVTFNNAANSFAGSGAGLTDLNADSITTGTLNIARFPAGGTWALNSALQIGTGQAVSPFVGINRNYTVGLEWFGVHAPVNSGYGGMYVTTEGATAWPFYGYKAGSEAAWTYLDGSTGNWHLNVDGNRLTVTDTGNVGIGTTAPTHRLHVTSASANRTVYAVNTSSTGVGVWGESQSVGIYGLGSGTAGTAAGVFGELTNAAAAGIGVRGRAPFYGVQGEATGNGIGVLGRAPTGIGVYGESGVASGAGIMGANTAGSGAAIGVQGIASSPAGYAGHFSGRGYFSGNLGIGILNPANPLSVVGNADISGQVSIGVTNADARLLVRGVLGEDAFRVRVEGGTKLLVKDNGGVGIGGNFGTVPANGLRIAGWVGIARDPTANLLEVAGNASKSSAGDWLANSDRRIKQDIQPVTDALDMLSRVRLVNFRYTDQYRQDHPAIEERRYLNVVAQEFAEVFPEHVKSSGEKLPDGSEILQVDTWPVTIYSAAAIQELNQKVDSENSKLRGALKQKDTEITELKQRLEKLEQLLAPKLAGGAR